MRRLVLALVAGAAIVLCCIGAAERARRSRREAPAEATLTETIPRAPQASKDPRRLDPRRAAADDSAPPRPSAPLSASARDQLAAVRAALDDPSPAATALLVHALDDEADVVRLEAIDGLVDRGHVPALAHLLKLDPADDPFVAPSILAGLGSLGHLATEESTRRAVLDRLVALLAAEKDRRGAESAGNVIMIVEALGALAHPDGAPVLERELGDPFHDVAGYTAIVMAIGKIGQVSSVAALTRFRATRPSAPPEDPFDRALEAELLEQIDTVTRALQGASAP